MSQLIYIPFDHLHRNFGALREANVKEDVIAFVESARMTTGRPWHPQRLHFLISSARHFAQSLRDEGFKVEYVKAATTAEGLSKIQSNYKKHTLVCAEPSSHRQYAQLKDLGASFIENDFFLTTRKHFSIWADSQKSYLMETFYRAQRARLNILIENGMSEEDAQEYIDFNIVGAYVGDSTPIVMWPATVEELDERS